MNGTKKKANITTRNQKLFKKKFMLFDSTQKKMKYQNLNLIFIHVF